MSSDDKNTDHGPVEQRVRAALGRFGQITALTYLARDLDATNARLEEVEKRAGCSCGPLQ